MKWLTAILILCACRCWAYTANDSAKTVVSDGSFTDTSNAVAYVTGKAQDFWTLTVGGANGDYSWPAQLQITTSYQTTIQGVSSNAQPTIRFNHANTYGISINAISNLVILKYLTLTNGTSTRPQTGLIGIVGNGCCFWFKGCHFLDAGTDGFGIQGGSINSTHTAGPFGLINDCIFKFPGGRVYNYLNFRCNGNIDGYPWTQNMTWGTTNSVVVEDTIFTQPICAPTAHVGEGDGGMRLTLRHCNITNLAQGSHGIPSGANESTLQVECYLNNFDTTPDLVNQLPYTFWQRGGSAVLWSNQFHCTSGNVPAKYGFFTVECASTDWASEGCASQLMYPADYPAYVVQQVGLGVVNGSIGYQTNYCWGNVFDINASFENIETGENTDRNFVIPLIFTNSQKPNYTPLVYPHPFEQASQATPLYPLFQIR